jgi:hypothetical protein
MTANGPGIYEGWELVFRLPITDADGNCFVEDKNCCSALLVKPELKLINDLLLIVLPSARLS